MCHSTKGLPSSSVHFDINGQQLFYHFLLMCKFLKFHNLVSAAKMRQDMLNLDSAQQRKTIQPCIRDVCTWTPVGIPLIQNYKYYFAAQILNFRWVCVVHALLPMYDPFLTYVIALQLRVHCTYAIIYRNYRSVQS